MSVAVLLFIRYGASLVALQGLLLYDLLLYASVSDIRTRKAEDWAWIAMIPLALCSIPRIGILSMLLGAGIDFLRLFCSVRFAVWEDTLSDFLPRSFLR